MVFRGGTWRGSIAVLTALAAVVLAAPLARAQPGGAPSTEALEQARRDFFSAVDAQDHGKYAEALDLYTRVRNATSSPPLLFNIATCHERLGHLVLAASAFREAQAAAKERGDADVAKESSSHLEMLAELTPRLTVRLAEGNDGAMARLDGESIDLARLVDFPIDPGNHRLEVQNESNPRVFDLTFETPVRAVRVVDVDLRALPPSEPSLPAPPATRRTYVPAVIAGGAAVACAASAIVTGLLAHDKRAEYNNLNAHPSAANRADRESLRSSGQTLYGANAVLVGAAALATATAVYFTIRPLVVPKSKAPEPPKVGVAIGPTAVSLRAEF
jgi:hypothetical protein